MNSIIISKQGKEFLNDPVMYEALLIIAATAGVTPEQYLIRFEEILKDNPEAIFGVFQKDKLKKRSGWS